MGAGVKIILLYCEILCHHLFITTTLRKNIAKKGIILQDNLNYRSEVQLREAIAPARKNIFLATFLHGF